MTQADTGHGDSPVTRRALVTLVVVLVLAAAAFPVAGALTSDDKPKVSTRMDLERAVGPTGAPELVAYVRTEGGDARLGTGDRLRLTCRDSRGRMAFKTSRALVDDRGIYAPHLHVRVPATLLAALRTCRGTGRGLVLEAKMPPVLG